MQAAINAASNLLPRTLPAPPTYSKSNPADTPILTLAVSSDTLPLRQVDDYADSILAQKISQVSGVGLVTINGGQKPAVRVQVDPAALAGTGLTPRGRARRRWSRPTSTSPRATSTARARTTRSPTNDQLDKAARLRAARPRLQERRAASACATWPTSIDGVENAQLAGWADDAARDHPQRAAPAGRQRHRGRRPGEGAPAAARGRRCRRGSR